MLLFKKKKHINATTTDLLENFISNVLFLYAYILHGAIVYSIVQINRHPNFHMCVSLLKPIAVVITILKISLSNWEIYRNFILCTQSKLNEYNQKNCHLKIIRGIGTRQGKGTAALPIILNYSNTDPFLLHLCSVNLVVSPTNI